MYTIQKCKSNRARYYNPGSGRFLSEDPIGFESGDYNEYRYVLNNPNSNKDPSGKNLYAITVVFRFATGVFGLTPIAFVIGNLGGSPLNDGETYNIAMDRAYNLLRQELSSRGYSQFEINSYINGIVGINLINLQVTSPPSPPQNSCSIGPGPQLRPGI